MSCNLNFPLFGTSAWHGVQVEDPEQYHIAVLWDSLSRLTEVSQSSCYPSQLPTTLPFAGSSLQRKLFDINQYPETALMAPITDMTYMFMKENKTFEKDLGPILERFAEMRETGAQGAYWGQSTEVEGMSIILIGWNSVQVNLFFLLVLFTWLMLSAGALRCRENSCIQRVE